MPPDHQSPDFCLLLECVASGMVSGAAGVGGDHTGARSQGPHPSRGVVLLGSDQQALPAPREVRLAQGRSLP